MLKLITKITKYLCYQPRYLQARSFQVCLREFIESIVGPQGALVFSNGAHIMNNCKLEFKWLNIYNKIEIYDVIIKKVKTI